MNEKKKKNGGDEQGLKFKKQGTLPRSREKTEYLLYNFNNIRKRRQLNVRVKEYDQAYTGLL